MAKINLITKLVLFCTSLSIALPAQADWVELTDLVAQDQILLRSIGLVAHPSTLESAHSHGQIGGSIGLGVRRPGKSLGTSGATAADDRQDAAQIHVVKGLNAPIDIGISVSHVADSGNALAGYLQWTIFEAFQLPSLATRVGFAKTFGYEFVDLNAASAQVLAGYDILQFASFYAGAGASFNYASIDLNEKDQTFSLARANGEIVRPTSATTNWRDRHFIVGLTIKPLPPFFAIGAEFMRTDTGIDSGSLKISVGM